MPKDFKFRAAIAKPRQTDGFAHYDMHAHGINKPAPGNIKMYETEITISLAENPVASTEDIQSKFRSLYDVLLKGLPLDESESSKFGGAVEVSFVKPELGKTGQIPEETYAERRQAAIDYVNIYEPFDLATMPTQQVPAKGEVVKFGMNMISRALTFEVIAPTPEKSHQLALHVVEKMKKICPELQDMQLASGTQLS